MGRSRPESRAGRAIKKVLPIVILGAAIFFTAGAALVPGIASLGGSWGSAISGFLAKIPASAVLKPVLTGAMKGAGYGSMVGAVTGDVGRGAKFGAVTGGIVGGLGALNAPAPASPSSGAADVISGVGPDMAAEVGGGVSGGGPAATVTAGGGPGLLSRVGGFISDNPSLVSGAITGIGKGLMQGMAIKAQFDQEDKVRREMQQSYANLDYDSLTVISTLPADMRDPRLLRLHPLPNLPRSRAPNVP